MNTVLFSVQQLFIPIFQIWPIWAVIFSLWLLCKKGNKLALSRWIKVGGIAVFFCFLLLRGLLLVAYPYQKISGEILLEQDSPKIEPLPLYVICRYGDLWVTHTEGLSSFAYQIGDTPNGNSFSKGVYENMIDGVDVSIESYILQRKIDSSVLSRIWSSNRLQIPAHYTGREEYVILSGNGRLDLTKSVSKEVMIGLYFAEADIYFPNTPGNKEYRIRGGSRTSGRLYFPEGPTYKVTDYTSSVVAYPSQFIKTGENTYIKEGIAEGTVEVIITVYMPKTLEVYVVNEHNK